MKHVRKSRCSKRNLAERMRYTVETEILAQLQSKSRAELQVLLERLIQQQPDIQPLVATLLKLPATGAGRACTLDPATISSQVTAAFSCAGRGWGAASHAAMELDRLSEIGDHCIKAGQWANAQAVYATIAEDILPSYEELEDEDQIAGVLDNCSAGLIACLEAQEALSPEDRLDEVQRKALLTSLFALWTFNASYVREESALSEVFARYTTASERALIEQWAQQDTQTGGLSRPARHLLEMLSSHRA